MSSRPGDIQHGSSCALRLKRLDCEKQDVPGGSGRGLAVPLSP